MYINNYQSNDIYKYRNTNIATQKQSYKNIASMSYTDEICLNNIPFTGWWSNGNKNKEVIDQETNPTTNNIKLSANEEILSIKLANTMHKLDDNKSLIVIGDPNSPLVHTELHKCLTNETSFIHNPSEIRNIYLITSQNEWPFIIAKKSDNECYIRGCAKNLSSDYEKNLSLYPILHEEPASLGDIIEIENGPKIRLYKAETESNDILFNRIYKASDFYQIRPTAEYETNSALQRLECNQNSIDDKNIIPIPYRTFDDVAGLDETIVKMKHEILFPIIYPDAFPDSMNKGTILYGEPGTGKTLLVLATIGEAKKIADKNINFVEIDAAGTTRELVGQSEEVWRDAFDDAIKKQPSILFVDEIDAVVSTRENDANSNNYNSIVTQILKKMSDLEKNHDKVWIIGATNRLDAIDPAIKRSGRFGNQIEVKRPDKEGCKDIFELYTKDKNIAEFDRDSFYQMLYDKKQTGADIATMVENALVKMYERCGIYKKMEDGSFQYSDLDNLTYIEEDFVPINKNNENRKEIKGFKI